jgi:flagellin
MSLGVLNNLSAMYAEHNLNNTQASLSKTLQQLSSGSKINSGADDAAGLSLVNGLMANSTALSQSQTNATEGVGLLQVADGALSQVTSLLNRAVTLATEASNGTLNSSQDTAANNEYQSILSEINNIGTTTTYNQQQVFGSTTNIYTGDSSSQGASINSLNIRTLSSASVGDTGGTMAYSGGQNNVFIDLTAGGSGANASITDSLSNTTNGSTINVSYLVKGANGVDSTATTTISVGGTTSYDNTAQGLIKAINDSGLGITASFTTAAAAGDSGQTATDTGIEISGVVGSGTTPSSASFSGVVGSGTMAGGDTLTGSITITDGSGAAQQITMAQVAAGTETGHASNLDGLIAYINLGASGNTETDSFGVHASKDGSNHLVLTSATGANVANTKALSVTSDLVDTSQSNAAESYKANAAYNVGVNNTATYKVGDSSTGQTAANVTFDADTNTSGGIATISYSDGAGQTLSNTSLSSQSSAQVALTSINAAITAVAAQDGYLGAQINTLNAVSSVLGTQQQNVVAAQNAVQATDYASAASDMSKYQILSQTGISALAQANSMSQLVTKLLQ